MKLTGAVSRVFMARCDRLYREKVARAVVDLTTYERYVDDSNQIAVLPPPKSEYNEVTGKI